MPTHYIKVPWTKQPPAASARIDWSNPIARKLGFLWIGPHTGGPFGRDLISGKFASAVGTGDAVISERSLHGHIVRQVNDGAAVQAIRWTGLGFTPNNMCAFWIQRHTDSTQAWNTSIAAYDNGGGYSDAETLFLAYAVGGNSSGYTHVWDGSTSQDWVGSTYGFAPGEGNWHSYGYRADFGSAKQGNWFTDGVNRGIATSGTTSETKRAIDGIYLMSNGGYPVEGWGGDMLFAAVFKEELTDIEFNSLHQNPWQLIEPQLIPIFVPAPANQQYYIEVPWTKQPPPGTPIDWSNPITRGLVFAGMSLDNGPPINLVDNVRADALSSGADIFGTDRGLASEAGLDEANVGWAFQPDGLKYESLRLKIVAHDQLTAMTLCKNRKSSILATGGETPFAHSGSGADPFFLTWGQGEDYSFTCNGVADNIDPGLESTGPSTADVWNLLGGTYDGANVYARINKAKGSGTASTGNVGADSLNGNVPYLSTSTGGSSTSWDGWVLFGLIWTRGLSDTEWNSMVDNPWQIFAPLRIPIFAPVQQAFKLYYIGVPWTRKPPPGTPLDFSNPLVAKLTEAYELGQNGLSARDMLTGALTAPVTGHQLEQSTKAGEESIRAATSDAQNRWNTDSPGPGSSGSVFFRLAPGFAIGSAHADSGFADLGDGAQTGAGGLFYWNDGVLVASQYLRSPSRTLQATVTLAAHEICNVCFSVEASNQHLAFNGDIIATDTNTETWGTGTFDLGHGILSLDSSLSYALIFQPILTQSEARSLTENMWQIFEPRRIPIFVPAAGEEFGPYTIVVPMGPLW